MKFRWPFSRRSDVASAPKASQPQPPKFPPDLRQDRVVDLKVGESGWVGYGWLWVQPDHAMVVANQAEVYPKPSPHANMKVTRVERGVEIVLPVNADPKTISGATSGLKVVGMERRVAEPVPDQVAAR